MENEKLFITWLQAELPYFVALIEEGSAAAGDPWQKGFSDHDLHVIVRGDSDAAAHAVHDFLEDNPLGDTCLVTVRAADKYAVGDSLNDVSLKFRAKTIVGEDIVTTKALPDREKATAIGRDGLNNLTGRLERRWLNLPSWTVEYARHKNYEILKNFFVFCAAYHYGKTGQYPTTRAEVASLIKDKKLAQQILQVTNNIGISDKAAQQAAIEAAHQLIPDIIS